MTDEEYTITDREAPTAYDIREAIRKARIEEKRRRAGITEEILKVNTAAGCIIAMQLGRAPAFKVFNMILPGVPVEEQEDLMDRFEDLWDEREKQVKKAIDYLSAHYDFIEKEAEE